jgi:hypothetical protein
VGSLDRASEGITAIAPSSSRERSVSSPGLRWIVMAVVGTRPWTKQRWALPFLCALATTRSA